MISAYFDAQKMNTVFSASLNQNDLSCRFENELISLIISRLADKFIEENKLTFEDLFSKVQHDTEFQKLLINTVLEKLKDKE